MARFAYGPLGCFSHLHHIICTTVVQGAPIRERIVGAPGNWPRTAFGEVWPNSGCQVGIPLGTQFKDRSQRTPLTETAPSKSAVGLRFLQTGDDRVARHTFVLGNLAEDRTKRAEPEGIVVRDRNPVLRRLGGLQNRHKTSASCKAQYVARDLHATDRISSRTR